MESGHIDNKQERGDRGALECANGDRGKYPWRALVAETASPASQERPGPGDKVRVYSLCFQHAAQSRGVHVVEATLDVEEKR